MPNVRLIEEPVHVAETTHSNGNIDDSCLEESVMDGSDGHKGVNVKIDNDLAKGKEHCYDWGMGRWGNGFGFGNGGILELGIAASLFRNGHCGGGLFGGGNDCGHDSVRGDILFSDLRKEVQDTKERVCDTKTHILQAENSLTREICDKFMGTKDKIDCGIHMLEKAICDGKFDTVTKLQEAKCAINEKLMENRHINTQEKEQLSRQIERCCCDMEKQLMEVKFQGERDKCDILKGIDNLYHVLDKRFDHVEKKLCEIPRIIADNSAADSLANLTTVNGVPAAVASALSGISASLRNRGYSCPC